MTTCTHGIFAWAHDLADQSGHDAVTSVHLTLGLLHEGVNVGAQILLYSCRIPPVRLELDLQALLPPPQTSTPTEVAGPGAWSSGDERMLEHAFRESREFEREYCGCEHLLLAILRDRESLPAKCLASYGVDYDRVRADVLRVYNRTMEWAGPAA